MKNFWPQRSKAKGFSIENLARKYREKISSVTSNNISNQSLVNNNLKFRKEEDKEISVSQIPLKRVHWANRDFSEYKEAA